MPAKVKTIVGWLVFAFLVYAVATHPDRFGTVIRSIWDFIYTTFSGIVTFFRTIVH